MSKDKERINGNGVLKQFEGVSNDKPSDFIPFWHKICMWVLKT